MDDILNFSSVRELCDTEIDQVDGGLLQHAGALNGLALTVMRTPGFSPVMTFMTLTATWGRNQVNSALSGLKGQFDTFMQGAQDFADAHDGF